MERLIKVGIVGVDAEGLRFLDAMDKVKQIEIVGVADCRNLNFSNSKYKAPFYSQISTLLELDGLDLIFVTTSMQQEFLQIYGEKKINIEVVMGNIVSIIDMLITDGEELRKVKGELTAILYSVQEAIEVTDNNGTIKYVNPAFSRVTGIPENYRIGKNIFQVSPNGALAMTLKAMQSIFGRRSIVGGSNVEVISNAAPIIVDGETTGAVVVFQPITDIYKLLEELQKSNTIIESLYAKIGQISGAKYTFEDLIGSSDKFINSLAIAKKAAKNDSTVLILGETGTGKELYAHAIHQASSRREKPFIKVNCAAIPENLLESEFFGHEKGAFSGAIKTKLGKVELANSGTLFLDEIGDMNLFLQAKLLRVLQEQEIERVGGTQTIGLDVRIITATNRNLLKMVETGNFREDLFYRLNVIELNIPPLRERKDDIESLTTYIIYKFNRKLGKKISGITWEALMLLRKYDWPGNIRELENLLERAMVVLEDDKIKATDVINYLNNLDNKTKETFANMRLDDMEKIMITKAIEHFGESLAGKKRAAQQLNISLATLYNKLKKYDFKN